MKKFIFLICATVCCTIFAKWHTWDTTPREGQLYMVVEMCPGVHYTKRQILMVSHYHKTNPIIDFKDDGWWDARPQDILQWFDEGSKVLYLPSEIDQNFVDRMKRLIK